MRARKYDASMEGKRYVGIHEFARYIGMGESFARQYARKIGAEVPMGRRRVYDLYKTDREISGEREEDD